MKSAILLKKIYWNWFVEEDILELANEQSTKNFCCLSGNKLFRFFLLKGQTGLQHSCLSFLLEPERFPFDIDRGGRNGGVKQGNGEGIRMNTASATDIPEDELARWLFTGFVTLRLIRSELGLTTEMQFYFKMDTKFWRPLRMVLAT